jgi:hypothetical protein
MKYIKYIIFIALLVGSVILIRATMPEAAKYMSTKYQIVTLAPSTFDLEVKVIITDDTAFARSYVMENLDSTVKTEDFDCRGTTFGTIDGKAPIVWLPYDSPVEIVNHELFHATINIMHWAGVSLSDETEETYAYELQYLTQQLNNQLNTTK